MHDLALIDCDCASSVTQGSNSQTLQHVQGTDTMYMKGTQTRGKTRGSMVIWLLTIL